MTGPSLAGVCADLTSSNSPAFGQVIGAILSTKLCANERIASVEPGTVRAATFRSKALNLLRQLDRVEIGRVLWQVANRRPRFLDRLPNAGNQVDTAVVHHDDVARLEHLTKRLNR